MKKPQPTEDERCIEEHITACFSPEYLASIGANVQAPSHQRELHHRVFRLFCALVEAVPDASRYRSARGEAGAQAVETRWGSMPVTDDTAKVTRVEVIDPSGRVLVCNPCQPHISRQDQGRTLKVFLDRAPDFLAPHPVAASAPTEET